MARSTGNSEVDQIARVIHERNAICSKRLLNALQFHHGEISEPKPDPEPEPEPEAQPELLSSANILDLPIVLIATNKIEQIKRIVCGHYGLSKAEIETNTRKPRIATARQIGMYLAHQRGYSLPEIGRRFGGRDHATVLYACRKFARLASSDAKLAAQLQEMQAEIPA